MKFLLLVLIVISFLFNVAWSGPIMVQQELHSFRPFTINRPIKVYIETHSKETSLYKNRYVKFVHSGLDEWGQALDSRLSYQIVNRAQNADMTITWVKKPTKSHYAGLTRFRFRPVQAQIQIVTEGTADIVVRMIVLHELGHGLGILQHSPDRNDVMFPTQMLYMISPRQAVLNSSYKLSERDKQTIRLLYGPEYKRGMDLYQTIASAHPVQPPRIHIFETAIDTLKENKSVLITGGAIVLLLAWLPPSNILGALLTVSAIAAIAWGGWLIYQQMFLSGFTLLMMGFNILPIAQLRKGVEGVAFYLFRAERWLFVFILFCLFLVVWTLERDPNVMIMLPF